MMKYLLDTHVVLWLAENSLMLSEKAKNIILNINTEKYVSIASAWEVAIKLGTDKLNLDGGLPEFFKIIDENDGGACNLIIDNNIIISIMMLNNYSD